MKCYHSFFSFSTLNLQKSSSDGLTTKWQMNPHDRGKSFAISSDGFLCQCREFKEWQGCRSTRAVTEGDIILFDSIAFQYSNDARQDLLSMLWQLSSNAPQIN